MRLSYALTGCLLAGAVATGACGSLSASTPDKPAAASTPAATNTPGCVRGSGFALSLVSDRGGQPTPVRAAKWFARHGGVSGIPVAGWREVGREGSSARVASGPVTVHVVQGTDRTWQVDSGQRCAGRSG
jgi:hypothetical protein